VDIRRRPLVIFATLPCCPVRAGGKEKRVMRILLITPEFPPFITGGIGAYMQTLAAGYAHRGHQVTVAGYRIHPTRRERHAWGESISLGRVRAGRATSALASAGHKLLHQLRAAELPGVWRAFALRGPAKVMRAALAVRRYLQRYAAHYDIVELSNWPGHGAFLPRPLCPYVVRLSTPAADSGQTGRRVLTWCEARACRRARLIIANSQAMRDKGLEAYGCRLDRTVVIYHGVPDTEIRDAVPQGRGLRLLYLGRAEERKGTDVFLGALAQVLPRCPDLQLTIVGANMEAYCQARSDLQATWTELRNRFHNRIETPGKVDETAKCRALAGAHWLVVPSRFESFGLVAVEAMRAGTPVLASAAGGLGEVCGMAPDNVLCRPGDVADLARRLLEIYERGEGHALRIRAATRKAYLRWFTADRMVDESLAWYRRVANLQGQGQRTEWAA
jgi:glycosyltransferase involved in cell wall biosynthesis